MEVGNWRRLATFSPRNISQAIPDRTARLTTSAPEK